MADLANALEKERSARADLALLALFLLASYGTSFFAGLYADDLMLLGRARDAPWTFAGLSRCFRFDATDLTAGYVPPALSSWGVRFFRPLVTASFKLDVALWGSWGPGYHATNLSLHFLCVCLVYFWGADLGLTRPRAFLLALFFTVYTPNTFAVIWVSGRTELAACVFLLASLMSFGRYLRSRRPTLYAVALGAYALALLSKETAVVLPMLLVLATFTIHRSHDRTARASLRALIPFFLLLLPYFALRHWALGGFPLPQRGFYFHPPLDPDFPRFLAAKAIHAVLAMVLQAPAFAPPLLFERALPVLAAMGVAATFLVLTLGKRLAPPWRWFIPLWVLIALTPTLPVGFHLVYYFLASPPVALLYVLLYARARSDPRRATRAGRIMAALVVACALGCAAVGVGLGRSHRLGEALAEDLVALLKARPRVERVFVIGLPLRCAYLAPRTRLLRPEARKVAIAILTPSTSLTEPMETAVTRVDDHTLDLAPRKGTWFTTGAEQVLLARDRLDPRSGDGGACPAYTIEVLSTAPHLASRDGSPLEKRLRSDLGLPPADQAGVTGLRLRLRRPLSDPATLIVAVTRDGLRPLSFD